MSNPLIFGTGVSSYKDEGGVMSVCEAAVNTGIRRFDSAPSYGTEVVLARCLHSIIKKKGMVRSDFRIQTKIDPIQMFEGDVEGYFKRKLRAMELDYIDVLLIHWPVYKYLRKTWEAMLRLRNEGVARKIGICNLRVTHLNELKGIGIIPEILQIERHPLNVFEAERNYCIENGIKLQDYSPLCKMHPLIKNNVALKAMSEKYGRSIGSLVLRWHLDTGATPIFTSKKTSRIEEYSDIDDFQLSQEDIECISSLNINHKLYLESLVCPGF